MELIEKLTNAIERAEHKPGQWDYTITMMGGVTTRKADLLDSLKNGDGEKPFGSFSHKRDAWLAIEAVNALPTLMSEVQRLKTLCEGMCAAIVGLRISDDWDKLSDGARDPLLEALRQATAAPKGANDA